MPTLRESASNLAQCRVSSRSTKLVQVRASCRRYDLRAGLRVSLANCVRSDARRRQSRSSLSNGSGFDIAHRLESLMRSVARYRVSCRWSTPHTTEESNGAKILQRTALWICLQRKALRRRGAIPKALDFGFAGGETQPGNILGMSGNLTQRLPERAIRPPDQHAEVRFNRRLSSGPISNVSNREFDLLRGRNVRRAPKEVVH
jgi:hypothetical protein